MAKPNYAYEKRQRELQKKQKKVEKAQRKTTVGGDPMASSDALETAATAPGPAPATAPADRAGG